MGLSSTTINYTAGDKTDNQWLNGAATSFVNLTLLLSFQLVLFSYLTCAFSSLFNALHFLWAAFLLIYLVSNCAHIVDGSS